jgi:hypothetical protein
MKSSKPAATAGDAAASCKLLTNERFDSEGQDILEVAVGVAGTNGIHSFTEIS